MALARTNLHGSITAGDFGTGVYTTTSFTPPSSSLLVVFVAAIENGGADSCVTDLTVAGGGWTYTSRVQIGAGNGFTSAARLWTAPVTTGVSMTLDVDCAARNIGFYGVSIVAYTGYDTSTPIGATGSNSQVGGFTGPPDPFSLTLSAAPVTTSEVFAGVSIDKNTAGVTPGSTFTEIHDFVNTSWGGCETEIRTGSTSTTVDWVDLRSGGGGLFDASGVAIEIKEAAAGPTFGGWPRRQHMVRHQYSFV